MAKLKKSFEQVDNEQFLDRFRNYVRTSLRPSKQKMLLRLLREISARRLDPLGMYEPTEKQLLFHQSMSRERIICGSNRSSKTHSAAFEVAMAVTGQHPWIDYPKTNGRCFCVAKDSTGIGQVMYRKLFVPGAFRIIFDEKLGRYRSWRPWEDGFSLANCRDSFPLIPARYVKSVAWEKKGEQYPRMVTLHNGWEISFFTANSKPPRGADIDLAWMDEEIKDAVDNWYDELSARLLDRRGRFIWSSTPQSATKQLWDLHLRALEERVNSVVSHRTPFIEEFNMTLDENPYIDEAEKTLLKEKYKKNPDAYKARIEGQFLYSSGLVYPNFSAIVHTCDPFSIPGDWTRYAFIDPGFSRAAAIFVAIPPKNTSDQVYVYDELFVQQADAQRFAGAFHRHVGSDSFQAFYIDQHGSYRTEQAGGKSIRETFAENFAALNLRSVKTGSDFIPVGVHGHSQNNAMQETADMVREWLWQREDRAGRPRLQIFRICENTINDMANLKYKKEPNSRGHSVINRKYNTEGADLIKYLCLADPPWADPNEKRAAPVNPMYEWFKKKMKEKFSRSFVNLGPGLEKSA